LLPPFLFQFPGAFASFFSPIGGSTVLPCLLSYHTCLPSADVSKWRHFQSDIILLCVRWYLRYSLSSRDLEEIMQERGLGVDHTSIYRLPSSAMLPNWRSALGLISAACNNSWRVDETSIKIKTAWTSLYRAVDSQGHTIEFFLSSTRDAEAAKRFFFKACTPRRLQLLGRL
jgi:transposase-like protein